MSTTDEVGSEGARREAQGARAGEVGANLDDFAGRESHQVRSNRLTLAPVPAASAASAGEPPVRSLVTARSQAQVRALMIVAIVVAAAGLRLSHIGWDRFQMVHPDERFIVWVADTVKWPGSLAAALDPATSPLNPFRWPSDSATNTGDQLSGKVRNYAYGHLPLYLLVVVAHTAQAAAEWLGESAFALPAWLQPLHTVGRHLSEYAYLPLVGRAISSIADLGTLLLLLPLARLAFGRRDGSITGLLAAAAYAFAVLPIQLSHFATVDVLLVFFVAASVAAAARSAATGGWPSWLLAAACAGLAVGTKFSAVLLAVPLCVALVFRLVRGERRGVGRLLLSTVGSLAAAGGVAFAVFAVTNPFAIIEARAYIGQIVSQNSMVSGAMDAPYTRQYIGTLPYLYFIQQLSQWGLAWPLGLAAWGGLIWAVVRAAMRRASPALIVILAWALPYFATTGLFHTKFPRYMAPLLPFLLICAGGMGVAAYRRLSERRGRRGRYAWAAVTALVLLTSIIWSLAFTAVYRQEHPWITASRWIYEQVPEGSRILTEEWDDALPLTLDGLAPKPVVRNYSRFELPMWDDDTVEKLDLLANELSVADYLFISSNRLYAPMERLSARYPLSSNYYRMLFAGELGYTRVADFEIAPRLGGLVIHDQGADESFTVYDHPHAIVFRNTGRLSSERLRERLVRYLPLGRYEPATPASAPVRFPAAPRARRELLAHAGKVQGLARPARQAPAPDAPLTLDRPVDTLPVVADFRWNQAASASTPLATLVWWAAISLLGWLVWPLLFPVVKRLGDRGYGLARTAGWLLIGWVHWLGASRGAWENRRGVLMVLLGLLAVAGAVAFWRQRSEIRGFLRARRGLVLAIEGVFGVAFAGFVVIRILNPDLWQPWNGGEKFMEMAFLNAILHSPSFPPYDPYFAGGILNYYYFGLYLVGDLIKLTGIVPEVAFNLAVPSLFALTATGVFSVAHNLAEAWHGERQVEPAEEPGGVAQAETDGVLGGVRRVPRPAAAGALAVVLTVLMGNLRGFGWLLSRAATLVRGGGGGGFDYWASSRVIPNTINEFPLWTFTFADLHPHLIAMPFGLLAIGLALNLALGSNRRTLIVANLLWLVLALGSLGAINTWDLPTYLLLALAVVVFAGFRRRGVLGAVAGLVTSAIVAALAVAAYWPFYHHYEARVGGETGPLVARFLGWVREPSPIGPWLTIWGGFLFLALSYAVAAARTKNSPPSEEGLQATVSSSSAADRRRVLGWLAGLAVVALAGAAWGAPAGIVAVPLVLLGGVLLRGRRPAAQHFVALLLFGGLGVVAGTEVLYLRDFLEGGEWYRMNTLFKFSVPAWLFLGTGLGVGLVWLWDEIGRAPTWPRTAWRAATCIVIGGGLTFLVAGVPARVADRFPDARPQVGTLDGMAYMAVGSYTWPDGQHPIDLSFEREAIRWLQDNVTGTPVLAEAPAGSYEMGGQAIGYDYYRAGGQRVASFTGLPTFVGHHQYEQRPSDQVGLRADQGQEFFRSANLARTRALMRDLRVGYVYVGRLETTLFPPESLAKFDAMVELGDLAVAYRNAEVTIYRVVQ